MVSHATNFTQVLTHVYRNLDLYNDMFHAISLSRDYHVGGKDFFLTFVNPLTGVQTRLTGRRIMDIVDTNGNVTWVNDEERIAGLVLVHINFFLSVINGYYEQKRAHVQRRDFRKLVTVPTALFPRVVLGNDTSTYLVDSNSVFVRGELFVNVFESL